MGNTIKRVAGCLIALGLLSGGARVCDTTPSAPKDCCGHSSPTAPKVPCSQMACCRIALPNAAFAVTPTVKVFLSALPIFAMPIVKVEPYPLAATSNGDPPGRPKEAHSGRSPPAYWPSVLS